MPCRHLVVDEGDVAPGELLHQLGEELGELVVVSAEAGEGPVLHRCTVLYCTVQLRDLYSLLLSRKVSSMPPVVNTGTFQ